MQDFTDAYNVLSDENQGQRNAAIIGVKKYNTGPEKNRLNVSMFWVNQIYHTKFIDVA